MATEHDGIRASCGFAHIRWCIIAVVRHERCWESECACIPVSTTTKEPVCHLAERTVSDTEPRADPIREFTPQCRVGVVYPDEFREPARRRSTTPKFSGAHREPVSFIA
jgi:hypothetical protein